LPSWNLADTAAGVDLLGEKNIVPPLKSTSAEKGLNGAAAGGGGDRQTGELS